MVRVAVDAAEILASHGVRADVINASTIKPLDGVLLSGLARRRVPLVTIEEHALLGGFGEAVAGHCAAFGQPQPIALLGIDDAFVPHGAVERLLELCGLTAGQIAERVAGALQARATPAKGGNA